MKFKLSTSAVLILLGYFASISPASAWDAKAVEGRKAWLQYNCYSCHGMRASGAMGPRLAGEGEDVREAVLRGESGGMPSYKKYKITQQEMDNIATYLRTIDLTRPNATDPALNPNEPYFMHWWESGTPSQ